MELSQIEKLKSSYKIELLFFYLRNINKIDYKQHLYIFIITIDYLDNKKYILELAI